MTLVFADSAYWVALTNPQDQWADKARALETRASDAGIVTTEEVLVEVLTHFSGSGPYLRNRVVSVIRAILADPNVTVIPQSHQSFLAGLALYESRPDKGYSLVDCASMATMRSLAIEEALTADRHFGQEGFAVLFQ
jgi:predicted nucleic acid-binding protein